VNALAGCNPQCGTRHHKATLTTAQVDAIRDAYERGEAGYRRLAHRFGVPWQTVRGIVRYRTRCWG